MLGAGGRALIERGFAAAGRELAPPQLEALFGYFLAHYNVHIAEHTRLYPGVEAALKAFARGRLAPGHLHQQDGRLGEDSCWRSSASQSRFAFICGQDTFGVGVLSTRSQLLGTIAAAGGVSDRAIAVGESGHRHQNGPSRGGSRGRGGFRLYRRARGRAGPDRVISHFDELPAACDALLQG